MEEHFINLMQVNYHPEELFLTGTDAGLHTVSTSGSFCKIEMSHAITGGSCLKALEDHLHAL